MNPTLSIIVPIYNVENYLVQCVDSILDQTYIDFELILIDDGSLDKCGDLCDSYALKDKRIRVIHKKNGGLSSARNAGIDIACGKYLSFIDSDDFISNDYYKSNMDYLLSHLECDMIVMQMSRYDNIKNTIIHNKKRELKTHSDIVGYLMSADYICSAWINIYKRNIFNVLRYPDGRIFEDGYILPDIVDRVNNLYLSDIGTYYYRIRSDSIMRKKKSLKDWDDILLSHVRLLDYCHKINDGNILFLGKYKDYSLSLIYALQEYPNGLIEQYIKIFQSYKYTLLDIQRIHLSLKEKSKLYLLKIVGYRIIAKFYIFWKIYRKF